jgi:hypothetical protein
MWRRLKRLARSAIDAVIGRSNRFCELKQEIPRLAEQLSASNERLERQLAESGDRSREHLAETTTWLRQITEDNVRFSEKLEETNIRATQRLVESNARLERQITDNNVRLSEKLEETNIRVTQQLAGVELLLDTLKVRMDKSDQCLAIGQRPDGDFESGALATANSRIGLLERCLGVAENDEKPSAAERLERLLEMRLGQLETRLMTHLEFYYDKDGAGGAS